MFHGGERVVEVVDKRAPLLVSVRRRFGLTVSSLVTLDALRIEMRDDGVETGTIEELPTQWRLWFADPDGETIELCVHR